MVCEGSVLVAAGALGLAQANKECDVGCKNWKIMVHLCDDGSSSPSSTSSSSHRIDCVLNGVKTTETHFWEMTWAWSSHVSVPCSSEACLTCIDVNLECTVLNTFPFLESTQYNGINTPSKRDQTSAPPKRSRSRSRRKNSNKIKWNKIKMRYAHTRPHSTVKMEVE